jgi:hypothetical protein
LIPVLAAAMVVSVHRVRPRRAIAEAGRALASQSLGHISGCLMQVGPPNQQRTVDICFARRNLCNRPVYAGRFLFVQKMAVTLMAQA